MPKELRRIVFSHPESTQALVTYGQKFNMTFPAGNIIKANFAGSSEYEFHSMKQQTHPLHHQYNVEQKPRSIIITFFDPQTLEHKYFNLTADFISAALIEYCISNKIILPKAAKKSIDVSEFNIVLDVSTEGRKNPATEPAPLSLED
jgi:hypothetical protein